MRKLSNDFVVKFVIICGIAFLIALSVTYLYLKEALLKNEKVELGIHANKILQDIKRDGEKFKNYVLKLKKEEVFHLISSEEKLYNASFITLIDSNGKVISRYSNITGDSIGNEEFFQKAVNDKDLSGFFHFINQKYLEREVLSVNFPESDVLAYSLLIPYKVKSDIIYIWYSNILNNKTVYLSDISFTHIDGAILLSGNKIISHFFDNHFKGISKDNVQIKNTLNNVLLEIAGKKSLFYEDKVYDFKKNHIASLFLIKDMKAIYKTLYFYTGFILFIFIFSSFVGIFFVMSYFKKFNNFINELLGIFKRFSESNYEFNQISYSNKIYEFYNLNNSLNNLSSSLKDYQELINKKISTYVQEYLSLYETIHELNEKQNFMELIDVTVDFIRNHFNFNVLTLEEFDKLDNSEKSKFKKFSYLYDGKEYGFYVEIKEDELNKLPIKFWDLFIDIFRTNFERIANFREVQKSYNEANYFAQILLKLLQKNSINEIFAYLLEKAREFCNGDASYIGLYNKSENLIKLQFFLGVHTEEFKTLCFSGDKGLGGYVLKECKTVFVENYFEDSRIDSPFMDIVKKEGIISVIAAPIIYNNEIYGVFYVGYRSIKKEVNREVNFMEKLAYVAALALEKETLIMQAKNKEEELRKAYEEILAKRKEINALLKNYKETNIELERINRELNEQYEIVKKSYDELERLNRAKDIFLGILSHELKSPLSVLKGYIDTLLTQNFDLSPDVKEIINSSKKSVNNLWQIVEDLLDYSRIELGQMNIIKKSINAQDLVNSVVEEIDIYLRERRQILNLNIQSGLFMNIDERWMRRALINLLTNSIKFSPDGKNIFLSIEKIKREELIYPDYVLERPVNSTEYVVITVKDEGVGINIQEINRIFERFYEIGDIKSHSTGKYKFMTKGLGLGLAFVKQIVTLHGGIIFAESSGYDPDTCPGSIFKIFIPVEESKTEEPIEEVKKKTVLIVESEHEVASFLEMVFSPHYNVVIVPNGGAGYLKTLELNPLIVFINILLPGYNGYEVCSMIKEDKRVQNIPVILYSSGIESFDEVRAEKAKANMFFSPLFDVDNLLRIVNYYSSRDN